MPQNEFGEESRTYSVGFWRFCNSNGKPLNLKHGKCIYFVVILLELIKNLSNFIHILLK